MTVLDSHFSTFINGGDLIPGDTVVGLRNGLNTRFNNTGGVGTFLPLAGGTMSGSIDMDGNAIINLPAPSNPLDAVNKTYVDALTALYLPLAGGTMSGVIDMNSHIISNLPSPTNGGDSTNKTYVDTLIAGASPLTTKGDLYTFTTVNARLAVGTVNGQMLQVNSATATGLAWSTASYPTVATSTGSFIYANGTNFVASTSLWPNTVGTSGKIIISDGTSNVYSTPTYPNSASTTGSFIYANGTNFVASTSLWPNTVGTVGKIIRSDGTTNTYTTSTFADTYAINTLLYNASANTVSGLPTANNGVLITSAGGVPSISSTLPSAVQTNITALGIQSQALDMGTHLINNVVDPVSAQDAATKHYVDQTALNGTSVYAVSAANLGTVTQSGSGVGATLTNAGTQATFALDGVNPPVGVNVLIRNTATGMTSANEGIYTVTSVGSGATNWILTRATSYDTATEINNTGLIVAQNGSTLAGTAWYNASTIVTVDTTAFSYSQFGNIIFPLTLSQGGTGASLTASNGGIVYSTGTTMAILAGTATAGRMLQSGSSGAPSWSTATYPATAGTSGNVMTSDGTNWNSSAPAASATSVIVDDTSTNATMYPVWVTASTGSLPLKVSSTKLSFNPSTGTMTLGGALSTVTSITSSAGLSLLTFTYNALATAWINIQNSSGDSPAISALGSNSTSVLTLTAKNSYIQIYDNSNTLGAELRWLNAAQTHYTSLKVATAQATNLTLTLPAADGTNAALWSNGSGVLSLATFANSNITSMTGLTGVLQAPTSISSSAGVSVLDFSYTASAVNRLYVQNGTTGVGVNKVALSVTGSDSAIPISIASKNSDIYLTDNTLTIAPTLRFYNAATTHYTGLKVATAQSTDLTLTLPAADAAAANAPLVSNASGVLSFLTKAAITQVNIQTFTSNGTYTPTSGMKYCIIECVGGGGGGGGTANNVTGASAGGGGGGGGYSRKVSTAATIGASQTVTVGAAGSAGASGNNNGGNGGDTSVGVICVGKGGTGGVGNAGGGSQVDGGAGGVLGTGDFTVVGQKGQPGLGATITTVVISSGAGGSSLLGLGGTASQLTVAGTAGNQYGGGGSGGTTLGNSGANAGGAGGVGIVIVTEYISV